MTVCCLELSGTCSTIRFLADRERVAGRWMMGVERRWRFREQKEDRDVRVMVRTGGSQVQQASATVAGRHPRGRVDGYLLTWRVGTSVQGVPGRLV